MVEIRFFGKEFSTRRALLTSALLAVALAWLSYRLNRAFGNFMSDEGYLWYGVQRVMAGELPLRDFMSYEIGRYFLAAAMLKPFAADGLLALRAVLGLVGAASLGMSICLVAIDARESRVWRLIPCALLFALWMVPRHKVFDIAVSALLMVVVYRLLVLPSVARYFQLGIAVGAAAVIGQNHGVYGVVASVLAIGLLVYGNIAPVRFPTLVAWAAGIVVGYLPVILTAVFAHGFLQAELDALHYLLVEYKGTNLPLPVPWPWTLATASLLTVSNVVLALFFLAIPLAIVLGLCVLVSRRRRGLQRSDMLFAAAWSVAVPYANVAFSRADAAHLAQAILPVLMLFIATPRLLRCNSRWQPAIAIGLLIVSLPLAIPLQPRAALLHGYTLDRATVRGDEVMIDPVTKKMLDLAEGDHEKGPVLAVPFYPGLAAVLRERSPIWEIYPLFPRRPSFERDEIARLRAASPVAIFISTTALDGRSELAYPITHPLMYEYIRERYRATYQVGTMTLFRRKAVDRGAAVEVDSR